MDESLCTFAKEKDVRKQNEPRSGDKGYTVSGLE